MVLVTDDEAVADAVDAALDATLADAPAERRREAESTLASGGRVVVVRDLDEAIAVVNLLAPEHLELVTDDPEALLPAGAQRGRGVRRSVRTDGLGDYVAGANHVLPTGGAARFASALRVDDFRKHVHVVRADAAAGRGRSPSRRGDRDAPRGSEAHAALVPRPAASEP